MLVMLNIVMLALFNVMLFGALLLPRVWLPKLRVVAHRLTMVPVNVVVWVPALSTTLKVPDRGPAPDGVKFTLTWQLAPPANAVPQVVLATPKSPVAAMVAMLTAVVPVFFTVAGCAALV